MLSVVRCMLCGMADTKMTKSAGEHWVCSVLAQLGWGAALTRDGLERTDILAVQTDGDRRMVEIQVKAARDNGPQTNWVISEKAQQFARSDREWFAFVILPADARSAPRTARAIALEQRVGLPPGHPWVDQLPQWSGPSDVG
jgi:hypothetical protein